MLYEILDNVDILNTRDLFLSGNFGISNRLLLALYPALSPWSMALCDLLGNCQLMTNRFAHEI